MSDQDKTKAELIAELAEARERIMALEEANEMLRESENKFRVTLEQSAISMQVYTPDGILQSYNRAFEVLFQIDGSQFVNKYNVFKDEKVKEIGAIPLIQKVLEGETVYDFINQYDPRVGFQSEEGRERWLKSCLYPIKNAHGQVSNFVIMHEDITNLKQHELELEALVKQHAATLEQKNEELAKLINIDKLTQVANRRCFENRIETAWQRLSRQQQPLSLIFIDIDCFKLYNDWYGHQIGDYCLNQVAQAIDSCVNRAEDLTARFGGEEFVVLLPDTDQNSAISVAEKIQKRVRGLKIPHETSKVSPHVTCSMGVVSIIPNQGVSIKSFISSADAAMFRAKGLGRNCYLVVGMNEEQPL